MMRLIDGHAHLEEIENLEDVIARAEAAGVFAVIAVGSDYHSNERTLEISGQYGHTAVYPALGIHPWTVKANEVEQTLALIEENIDKAVAVGEIGLDYWLKEVKKDSSKVDRQREVLKGLLQLAKRYNKPAIIHARGSWEDCLHLAMDAQVQKAVFHWYSGPLETLERILSLGYFISATPAAEYSPHHQRAILQTPLEGLLLETDAPVSYQGKESEPADVIRTLAAVARIKRVSEKEVAEITTNNALNLFQLESIDGSMK